MLKDLPRRLIAPIALLLAVFQIIVLIFYPTTPSIVRGVHLVLTNLLVLLAQVHKEKRPLRKWIAGLIILFNLAGFIYAIFYLDALSQRGMWATNVDIMFAAFSVITVFYTAWCTTGNSLPIISGLFILYTLFGMNLPGILGHRGYPLKRVLVTLYGFDGVHGLPIGTASTTLAMFLLFGQVFEKSGIGDFMIQVANALTRRSRGGAAKTAVVASGFFGTISGSAVTNVVGTGTFTIPMMKKLGYPPVFAGAVEAVASTGGQLMPPIMASAAFIMAEMLGIPYTTIAKSAIIPALIYYGSCWLVVDLRSARLNLRPSGDQGVSAWTLVRKNVPLLVPLVILVYMLFIAGWTPIRAAFASMVASVLMMALVGKGTWAEKGRTVVKALEEGGVGLSKISPACAVAGTVAAMIGLTGLGTKISAIVARVSGGDLIPALLASMAVALVFGMGMPTTISYILCASILAPALINIGMLPLVANMFILYFAILSNITPPVAMAAYAAAGISGAGVMETGWQSVKMALPLFIVPYVFALDPAMLLIDATPAAIVRTVLVASGGVAAMSFATEGWLSGPIPMWTRLMFAVGAIALLYPDPWADALGVILVGIPAAYILMVLRRKPQQITVGR